MDRSEFKQILQDAGVDADEILALTKASSDVLDVDEDGDEFDEIIAMIKGHDTSVSPPSLFSDLDDLQSSADDGDLIDVTEALEELVKAKTAPLHARIVTLERALERTVELAKGGSASTGRVHDLAERLARLEGIMNLPTRPLTGLGMAVPLHKGGVEQSETPGPEGSGQTYTEVSAAIAAALGSSEITRDRRIQLMKAKTQLDSGAAPADVATNFGLRVA